jgi:hypothetical protein
MRKFLYACFIFLLAGGGVFSADIKVGNGSLSFKGKILSGFQWSADDLALYKDDDTPISANSAYSGKEGRIKFFNNDNSSYSFIDENTTGLRADLEVRYENGRAGFKALVRNDNVFLGDGSSTYPRLGYAWLFLYNNVFRIVGGFVDADNPWNTGGPREFTVGARGVRVEIQPFLIPAIRPFARAHNLGTLNVGFWLNLPTAANGNVIYDDNWEPMPGAGDFTLENIIKETYVGLRWTLPSLFRITAMYKFDSNIDNAAIKHRESNTLWSGADEENALWFGFQLYTIPNTTFSIDGLWYGLGNLKARGRPEFRQFLQYTFASSNVKYLNRSFVGLYAQEIVYFLDMKEYADWDFSLKPWVRIQPYIGYDLTENIQLRLVGGIAFGHRLTSTLPTVSATAKQPIVYEDLNFYVIPMVWFKIGDRLTIRTWYAFNRINYGDLGDSPALAGRAGSSWLPLEKDGVTPVESIIKHQAVLQFRYEF